MNDIRATREDDGDGGGAPAPEGLVKSNRKRPPTERTERLAERMAGRSNFAFACSMLLNFSLAAALFVSMNKGPAIFMLGETNGKFYQARGPVEQTDVMKTLMETFARRYVRSRETLNLHDDQERYEWVRKNSRNDVWKAFNAAMNQGNFYKAAVRNHTTWAVKVVSAWQSDDSNKFVWSLEIEKSHFSFNRIRGPVESWIIQLKMDRDTRLKTPEEQFDNPAALYVWNYSAHAKDAVVQGNTK